MAKKNLKMKNNWMIPYFGYNGLKQRLFKGILLDLTIPLDDVWIIDPIRIWQIFLKLCETFLGDSQRIWWKDD